MIHISYLPPTILILLQHLAVPTDALNFKLKSLSFIFIDDLNIDLKSFENELDIGL